MMAMKTMSVNTRDVFHVFGNVGHVEIDVADISVGDGAVIPLSIQVMQQAIL